MEFIKTNSLKKFAKSSESIIVFVILELLGLMCFGLGGLNNIYFVVDGAQSVPHLKTDVNDLNIDFLAFSGHKMLGPTGIGVLYGKYNLLDKTSPINFGGGMNTSFEANGEFEYKSLPTRLEAGTQNIEGVLGLGTAIDYLNSIGMENIHKYELELRKYLII